MSHEPIGDRRILQPLPGGGMAYTFLDDGIRIEARYLRREHGQLHAEVDVQCEWAGVKAHDHSLSCADMNLSSQSTRRALAGYCAERSATKPDAFDWMGAVDAASIEIIKASRQGDEVIILDDAPNVTERDFDVCGLKVPADASSMLIAHGDSLKSMILLFILGTLARRGHVVLMLDWEWTAARHLARKHRMFGAERLDNLRYLRCVGPLTVQGDPIRRYCDAHHVEFVGIDSVGLACDGKLADDETARSFHRVLATLPPSLSAAHVAKSSIGPDTKSDPLGPFGSVFFSNLCRASWLVKKQPGALDDLVTVGLFPQKQNDGARTRPVGLAFTFAPERIGVQSVDLAEVEGLAEKLPLAVRMAHALQRGPLSFAEMASVLDAKVDSIIKAASRGKAFTKVTSPDGVARISLVARQVA